MLGCSTDAQEEIVDISDRAQDFLKDSGGFSLEAAISNEVMYKAAGEAFKFAERWVPERIEKSWECGWHLAETGNLDKCDPFELLIEEPESAR